MSVLYLLPVGINSLFCWPWSLGCFGGSSTVHDFYFWEFSESSDGQIQKDSFGCGCHFLVLRFLLERSDPSKASNSMQEIRK